MRIDQPERSYGAIGGSELAEAGDVDYEVSEPSAGCEDADGTGSHHRL